MTYDRAHFIAKFEAIPDERWCVGLLNDVVPGQYLLRHCVLGHCTGDWQGYPSFERAGLILLFEPRHLLDSNDCLIGRINDGKDDRYPQSTPKARVLAALHDLP